MQVLVPDLTGRETPLPGTVITAIPFNRDSIREALESRAALPRPHTRALDSLFQAFRAPFFGFATVAWQADRLRRLRDSLAGAAGADSLAAGRLGRVEDSLRILEPELTRARRALAAARDSLWPRIERLREEVERWEHTTFQGYDSIVRALTRERFRTGLIDTTDSRGWVVLVLPAGRWWISARSPDPADPNAQWSWNLPVDRDTIRLTTGTARHLPRY